MVKIDLRVYEAQNLINTTTWVVSTLCYILGIYLHSRNVLFGTDC